MTHFHWHIINVRTAHRTWGLLFVMRNKKLSYRRETVRQSAMHFVVAHPPALLTDRSFRYASLVSGINILTLFVIHDLICLRLIYHFYTKWRVGSPIAGLGMKSLGKQVSQNYACEIVMSLISFIATLTICYSFTLLLSPQNKTNFSLSLMGLPTRL